MTDEAARQFAERMQATGFTDEGINGCSFDPADHDEPDEPTDDQYCLYTVVDGEYVHGAAMSAGLADLLNSGDFEADPRFVVTASSMEKAQELELYLRSGSLPAETEVQAE